MPRAPKALAPTGDAAAASAATLANYTTHAITVIFDQMEKDLGGRQALLSHLLTAPDDPRTTHLVGLLADPASDGVSLGRLMKAGGVTLPQLLQALTQAGFAKAFMKSVQVIAEKTPAVVEDVLARAAPHYLTCATCGGTGAVGDTAHPDGPPVPCESCKGTGQELVLPDLKRQELALDLARMLPTKAAIVQHFDQRKNLGSGTLEGMTALIKATDNLLAHARPAPRSPQSALVEGGEVGEEAGEVVEGDIVPGPEVDIDSPA
jgi:hypothetical protein